MAVLPGGESSAPEVDLMWPAGPPGRSSRRFSPVPHGHQVVDLKDAPCGHAYLYQAVYLFDLSIIMNLYATH